MAKKEWWCEWPDTVAHLVEDRKELSLCRRAVLKTSAPNCIELARRRCFICERIEREQWKCA